LLTVALGLALVAGTLAQAGADKGTGSAVTVQESKDLVAFHNKVRKEVGVGPVKWSNTLAKFAQEWADHLAELGKLEHRPRDGKFKQRYGENLAIGVTVLNGAEAWYAEKKDYKAGTPIPQDFASFKPGHYTQMVWRKSVEFGAGKATIKKGMYKGKIVVVGNYNPPGNALGQKPY
jgi:pathogenesis-related protein 1